MRTEQSGKYQPLYLRMLTVGRLPKIVGRLFGKVLPGRTEASQFKSISKIGRYCGTPIEHRG